MKAALTKTQATILDALKTLTEHGGQPTFDELAQRIGISSRGRISADLVSLRRKGRIAFGRKLSSIKVIDEGLRNRPESPSSEALQKVIEEAADALCAQIGQVGAAHILERILARQRAKAHEEKPRQNRQVHDWREAG